MTNNSLVLVLLLDILTIPHNLFLHCVYIIIYQWCLSHWYVLVESGPKHGVFRTILNAGGSLGARYARWTVARSFNGPGFEPCPPPFPFVLRDVCTRKLIIFNADGASETCELCNTAMPKIRPAGRSIRLTESSSQCVENRTQKF